MMANPAAIGNDLAVLEATTAEATVTLNPQRDYTLAHDGEDTSGADAATTIYLAVDAAVIADANEGLNKFKLVAQRALTIGPGIAALRFKTASGAPTMSVAPGRSWHGNF